MLSESNTKKLKTVRTLILWKPYEDRHSHTECFPLSYFASVPFKHLITVNLCFKEIEEILSTKLEAAKQPLYSLDCKEIDPWCPTSFSFDIIAGHKELKHVSLKLPIDNFSRHDGVEPNFVARNEPRYRSFTLTRVRDTEIDRQRRLLEKICDLEEDRTELYLPESIEEVDRKINRHLEEWYQLDNLLLQKYTFFSKINHLDHLAFGNCYSWTPVIWKKVFFKVVISSPSLKSLELYGWDQLGFFEKSSGPQNAQIQAVRIDAEMAISECFKAMHNLTFLRLVDFVIGPGLFNAAKSISKSLRCLEIVYTPLCLRYCAKLANMYCILVDPLKEFIYSAFSNNKEEKVISVYFHPEFMHQIKEMHYVDLDSLLDPLYEITKDLNLKVYIKEIC